jgi:hypothetical protein
VAPADGCAGTREKEDEIPLDAAVVVRDVEKAFVVIISATREGRGL